MTDSMARRIRKLPEKMATLKTSSIPWRSKYQYFRVCNYFILMKSISQQVHFNCFDSFHNNFFCTCKTLCSSIVIQVPVYYIKSNLECVTRGGIHLRGLAPGQRSSEGTSQRWRAVGDSASDLNSLETNSRPSMPTAMSINTTGRLCLYCTEGD